MALALAMALQELATNAVKHGALSNPAGEVRVLWEMSEDPGGCHLHMKWQESGGPPLVENRPTRGFGTRLIERTLKQELDGDVHIEFAPAGLVCEFHVPIRPATKNAKAMRN